ncbi:DUF3303 domain-containing protein [Collimonas antrihumi]|uniref:DUF3303 domain-containing protein n=1 Tax=Collimonas antrihumi TaxID=1940615 RepID=UPI001B8D4289|nr:DUF3303 family protein [Collimonas antrihumi]
MKFITTFSWKPDPKTREEGIARFKKTGGLPPKGVTLLGRWTRVDLDGGFDLIESDDPKAIAEFALMWSDLMELSTVPILDDEALAAVLQRIGN